MTKRDEQHKAQEIVRWSTLLRGADGHDTRVRDIILSGGQNPVCSENKETENKETGNNKLKYQSLLQKMPNIGLALFIEDAAYQVGRATVVGEQNVQRVQENYERLMAANGMNYDPSQTIKDIEKMAKNVLKLMGYQTPKKKKK